MLDLTLIAVLTAWSLGVGLRILERLHVRPETSLDALGLAIPLGFGSLALATLGLGELGVLNRGAVTLILILGTILAVSSLWRFARETFADWKRSPRAFDLLDYTFLTLLILTLLGTLLTSLTPVTDGDALCYHLQVPKVFLWQGGVFFDPDLHETVYPLITELLYAVALMFRGPVACRLLQWVLGLVFAINVASLARVTMGRRAWWAGVIALLVPAISNGMSAPLNDVALAAFGTSALAAWLRYHDRPSISAAILIGLSLGFALGVKYPALVLFGILALAIVSRGLLGQGKASGWLVDALIFSATALIIGGVWYLRAWLHTGNPVFPYFRHVFGGAGLDEVLDVSRRAMVVTPWNVLTALVPMTLKPDRFDSFSHQFGPIFLWFLPALFLERAPRRIFKLAAVGYLFLMLCVTQRQSMRFVLIALGPMSVGVAWLVETWWKRRSAPSRILVAVFVLGLTFESALALARTRHGLPAVLGRESSSDFLAHREPTFQVGRWVAENLPTNARMIGQDHRGYYIPRPYSMELAHRRRTGLGKRNESGDTLARQLASEGYTHLLLCPPIPEDAVEFDPTLGRVMATWLAKQTPIYQRDLKDGDGVVRRYAIYELGTLAQANASRRVQR